MGLLGGVGVVETEGPCALPLTPGACQVEVFRRQDAERGVRVAQVLEGFISRKVVKQTVMTVVYGVTRYGGRLQIERRLRELSNFPQVRRHALWVSLRCEGGTVPPAPPAPPAPQTPGCWTASSFGGPLGGSPFHCSSRSLGWGGVGRPPWL